MKVRARKFILCMMALMMIASVLLLSACDSSQSADEDETLVIGTMPTEDFLPLWVAEKDGLFTEFGVDVRIEVFQSAQELSTALASGTIHGAMTDVPVAANLSAGGTPMNLAWVTLGATADEGRFGIMVGPESDVTSLEELAGVPIGVGSGTMLEYIMGQLMISTGVDPDDVVVEELKKLPVRYQLVLEGQVEAGVFPQVMLVMGEAAGAYVVADDTTGANLSQSVMAFSQEIATSQSGEERIEKVAVVWDESVARLSADPEVYRDLLASKANIPADLAQGYEIDSYPLAQVPEADVVEPVLQWMADQGYVGSSLEYDGTTGDLIAG